MKFVFYIIVILFFSSCKTTKRHDINDGFSESVKSDFINLKNKIEYQWDNTYNFRHDRIQLPDAYKNKIWKNELGEFLHGNKIDTIFIKYLIYGEMLDSLIVNIDNNLHFTDIKEHYGRPSIESTNRNSKKITFFYFFNTVKYPNCSCNGGRFNYSGGNCSHLKFEFNNNGNLIKVHKMMFNP